MARRFQLQTLLDLAKNHSDDAAKQLHVLKTRWHESEENLRQLMVYREEYRARLAHSMKQGMRAMSCQDFHRFLGKLDQAIKQQAAEVDAAKARWEEGKREWLNRRRKVQAYDTLHQRHLRSEATREARLEQREQDEFAGKQFGRKSVAEDGTE